jgi:hypothetical protein
MRMDLKIGFIIHDPSVRTNRDVGGELVARDKEELGSEVDEREEEGCKKCGLVGLFVFLTCDGPGKNHYFCWRCSGYSSASLTEQWYPGVRKKLICIVVFCQKHLKELEACQPLSRTM